MTTTTATVFEQINTQISPERLLELIGINYNSGGISCPIPSHRGDNNGNNFHINGDQWTCFSHHCGEPYARDTVNLYCQIEYGKSWPELNSIDKNKITDFFKCHINLSENVIKKSRHLYHMSHTELVLVKSYLDKIRTLSEIALETESEENKFLRKLSDKDLQEILDSGYNIWYYPKNNRSKLFQKFITFFACVEIENIDINSTEVKNMFCDSCGFSWFFDFK